MIHYGVLKLIKTFVGSQRISEDCRASEDVFPQFSLKRLLFGGRNNLHANLAIALAAALQYAHDCGFVFAASASDLTGADAAMHISRLAANEGFVSLDLTRQLVADLLLVRQSNPMEHEPCGFLTDSKAAVDFPGGNTILGIGDQPHCSQPLVETDGAVLEDRPDLDGKLTLRVMGRALPAKLILEETDAGATAIRALHYAVWPALFRQVFEAVSGAGKVEDCFLKSADLRDFHVFIVSKTYGLRKSIIALNSVRREPARRAFGARDSPRETPITDIGTARGCHQG